MSEDYKPRPCAECGAVGVPRDAELCRACQIGEVRKILKSFMSAHKAEVTDEQAVVARAARVLDNQHDPTRRTGFLDRSHTGRRR